jgi:nucleoside-diphosphate-sugar epimerase
MAYGTYGHGGRPVQYFLRMRADEPIPIGSKPRTVSLIHEDDIVRNVEPLLKAAAVPATIVNWGDDEAVDERELYTYVGKLAGKTPRFVVDDAKAGAVLAGDAEMRRAVTGPSQVHWKDGLRRTLETFNKNGHRRGPRKRE